MGGLSLPCGLPFNTYMAFHYYMGLFYPPPALGRGVQGGLRWLCLLQRKRAK